MDNLQELIETQNKILHELHYNIKELNQLIINNCFEKPNYMLFEESFEDNEEEIKYLLKKVDDIKADMKARTKNRF